jgi:hypothetical protein
MARMPRTVWALDIKKIKELVNSERQLRDTTLQQIQEQTGVQVSAVSRFLTHPEATLHANSLVSLIKWANGNVSQFVVRQRNASRHAPSRQEIELRTLAGYLDRAGIKPLNGESPVDAAMRILTGLKESGALDEVK